LDPSPNTKSATDPEPKLDRKECFVISPIGEEDSEVRKQANRVLEFIISKAIGNKYDVRRADDITKPGLITVQVIQRLQEAPLVIADLTGGNPNVYYELAIRHFLQLPVIHLITAGQQAPFDVHGMRYVSYDTTLPESVEAAQKMLQEHVESIEKGEKVTTPIQFAKMLAAIPASSKEEQFLTAIRTLHTAVAEVQGEMRQMAQLLVTRIAEIPRSLNYPMALNNALGVQTLGVPTLGVTSFLDNSVSSRLEHSQRRLRKTEDKK
jgi:hypothetical protein